MKVIQLARILALPAIAAMTASTASGQIYSQNIVGYINQTLDPIGNATFFDVVGRNPQNGEWVTLLDAETQVYTTTTFEDGTWSNGDPELAVGESALFYLDPVPEPSVACLCGIALLALACRRPFGTRLV